MINKKMVELINESIRMHVGMVAVYPQLSMEETVSVIEMEQKFNGCFSVNNSTLCYIANNEVYVTPRTRKAINILCENKFTQKSFYVPFSNGDYPKHEKKKWDELCEKARNEQMEDFTEDCIAYSQQHQIASLSEDILNNCFEMPKEGTIVKRFYYEECFYPVINYDNLNSQQIDYVGHYCANNGRVVFIYSDGRTFVAKGYGILNDLQRAGYLEKRLFVPFSNGEEIQDAKLKEKWDSLKKFS